MNRLFVAYKPPFISSNGFLSRLKRKYREQHAGFSGTLDPFAKGSLIVAFGQFSRLFCFLAKSPKRYRATLWLGAASRTLDIEAIESVATVPIVSVQTIETVLRRFLGKQMQTPPLFSALRVGGKRAYKLARSGDEVLLAPREIEVFRIALVSYCHPFLSFECDVSEGCYVRVLGREIAAALGADGALSSLERLSEGAFHFEGEKPLDPLNFIDLPRNFYNGDDRDLYDAKKFSVDRLRYKGDGDYLIAAKEFFVIITVFQGIVTFKLGHMDTNAI
ncbi:tRNA pseudouridine synthase B [Campylobacterota bacterium]|nr:tRNA pseudouridine synthase B [Campylobacterota bacterium]